MEKVAAVRGFWLYTRKAEADLKKGADIYLEIAGDHADTGREVNVFELYQRLTMDYVGRAAFGFDRSFQRGPEDAFAAATKVILRSAMKGPFHILLPKHIYAGGVRKAPVLDQHASGRLRGMAMAKEATKVDRSQKKKPRGSYRGRQSMTSSTMAFITKAGTAFMSPTLQIHRDERYWPDPLNFNPDRFAPENEGNFHKVAYQVFGIGPRNCLGMRMALMALNLTIARLVQRFRLELGTSQGEGPLDIGSRAIVSEPAVGPWIVFRRT
ncbi:hypothetical protein MTO96_012893 [Rhipicephalus appendiculatus]